MSFRDQESRIAAFFQPATNRLSVSIGDCYRPFRQRIPEAQGLYHPQNEHDACGMGLVASIRGEKSHEIIRKGLEVLINLTHRGAAGCDPLTRRGDDR